MSIFNAIKGLFSKKKENEKPVLTVSVNTDDIDGEDERQYELYHAYMQDQECLDLMREYYDEMEKMNAAWSVMYNLNDYCSERGERFEIMCAAQIDRFLKLVPKWKKYDQTVPRTPVFKQLAMLYERQGRIDDAANVCLRAIEMGYEADGTNGGMRGRLARMIRKGAHAEMPPDL